MSSLLNPPPQHDPHPPIPQTPGKTSFRYLPTSSAHPLPRSATTPIPVTIPSTPSINDLLTRLEAATSRLEDIANSTAPPGSVSGGDYNAFDPPPNGLNDSGTAGHASSRSEPELSGIEREASTATVRPAQEAVPERIAAMDELITEHVAAFVGTSRGLDPLIEEQSGSVAQAFADQRRFLLVSTKAKKPDPQSPTFMDLLSDLQHHMGSVGDIRDSNRGSPMKEHLAMVGEGITALQWLIMDGKPADYVSEVIGGAQLYGNRVLKAYKEGDQAHVKFVRAYYALLEALKSYIKKHYPSGVTWNNNGDEDPMRAYQEADAGPTVGSTTNGETTSSAAAAAPPPPPPPPPLPNFDNNAAPSSSASSSRGVGGASAAAGGGDMGAVFEQLNKGEAVTAGLKKVDKSQMTHKNPSLRVGSTVPEKDAAGAASANDISRSRSPGPEIKPKPPSMRQNSSASSKQASTAAAAAANKPAPKKELDGNKWLVSNHDAPTSPIEIPAQLSHSLLITNCRNATFLVKGKANAISLSDSPRCQLLVDDLVSALDIIKCPNVAVQITGAVPTVMLDQVDGATIYLSGKGLGVEVFSSKCSAVNLVLPPPEGEGDGDEGDEGDSLECPVPEQIRTVVKGRGVVSEIVEHAG